MHLPGHVFLVTGGASGLGAATARRFAQQGAKVVIADTNAPAGERLAEELGQARALFQPTDVANEASGQTAVDSALRHFGGLHGLVNCAGILAGVRVAGREGPHDLALFEKVIRVNLIGTFNMLRLAAAAMTASAATADGERGVIINTSSAAAFEGQIGQAAYSASKGGVASMTLPIARELARFGIRVVAVAPGVFETAMMQAAPEVVRQSLVAQTVFPARLGLPEEFALFAQQIVENPMLNGAVLRLDGAIRMAAK